MTGCREEGDRQQKDACCVTHGVTFPEKMGLAAMKRALASPRPKAGRAVGRLSSQSRTKNNVCLDTETVCLGVEQAEACEQPPVSLTGQQSPALAIKRKSFAIMRNSRVTLSRKWQSGRSAGGMGGIGVPWPVCRSAGFRWMLLWRGILAVRRAPSTIEGCCCMECTDCLELALRSL